jgi:hypothetical protein
MSGVAGLAMLIFLSFGGEDTLDPFDRPIGTDFSAFWHAGRMANGGNAVGASAFCSWLGRCRASLGAGGVLRSALRRR